MQIIFESRDADGAQMRDLSIERVRFALRRLTPQWCRAPRCSFLMSTALVAWHRQTMPGGVEHRGCWNGGHCLVWHATGALHWTAPLGVPPACSSAACSATRRPVRGPLRKNWPWIANTLNLLRKKCHEQRLFTPAFRQRRVGFQTTNECGHVAANCMSADVKRVLAQHLCAAGHDAVVQRRSGCCHTDVANCRRRVLIHDPGGLLWLALRRAFKLQNSGWALARGFCFDRLYGLHPGAAAHARAGLARRRANGHAGTWPLPVRRFWRSPATCC
jgi:hypothetical protein